MDTMSEPQPGFELLQPLQPVASAVELDADQRRVVTLPAGHGPVLVIGAPGSGRTTTTIEYAVQRMITDCQPDEVVMLAGSRQAASQVRNALTARLQAEGLGTRAETPVRSVASFAFDVIRRMRAEGYLEHVEEPPRLLAGAEQDRKIAEILETYREENTGPQWPESLQQAVGLAGFRREVRELIDRCSEYGIEPGQLQRWGEEYHYPEWVAVAELLQDYRDDLDLRSASAFDPAGLITRAADYLADPAHRSFLDAERQRRPVVIIDDIQDANPAVYRLLEIWASDLDVVMTASPTTTVQGFRGATPQLLSELPQRMIRGDLSGEQRRQRIIELTHQHRMAAPVFQAWRRAAQRIPVTMGLPSTVPATPTSEEAETITNHNDERAEVRWVASAGQEKLLVHQQLLQLHLEHKIPYSNMAVIARTASRVDAIARSLSLEGIPVHRRMADVMLNQQAAVSPLLTLVAVASSPAPPRGTGLAPERLSWLLTGRYGGATAVHVRQLRRRLLQTEQAQGGSRSSHELLDILVDSPEMVYQMLSLDPGRALPDYARSVVRIGKMLNAMRGAVESDSPEPSQVLWAGWQAARVATSWETTALEGEAQQAAQAHRDLDAVIAVFDAAERYEDQFPGETSAGFVEYLENQDLPMDSLSETHHLDEAVSVLTPSSAVIGEWDAVLIVGVQEGIWPNTRVRGQLLKTGDLVDLVRGRTTHDRLVDRIAEVRTDEMRTFAAAISRARKIVIGSAVATEESQPSAFLDRIQPWHVTEDQPVRPITSVPTPLTRRMLVATLRRELENSARQKPEHRDESRQRDAATALAVLSDHGVSSANPNFWWGLAPLSSTHPAAVAEDLESGRPMISLSPSSLGAALANPAEWYFDKIGASTSSSEPLKRGTFVHALAEKYHQGRAEDLQAGLEELFPVLLRALELDPESWQAEGERQRIKDMLSFFSEYVIAMRHDGRSLVATELGVNATFTVEDLDVKVNGKIDRLEKDSQGRPTVVDLKTGKSMPRSEEVDRLPQLATYQALIISGVLKATKLESAEFSQPTTPGGAMLVQLGTTNQNLKVQHQQPVVPENPEHPEENWASQQIRDAARRVSGASYLTWWDPGEFQKSSYQILSPITRQGRQITEWNL